MSDIRASPDCRVLVYTFYRCLCSFRCDFTKPLACRLAYWIQFGLDRVTVCVPPPYLRRPRPCISGLVLRTGYCTAWSLKWAEISLHVKAYYEYRCMAVDRHTESPVTKCRCAMSTWTSDDYFGSSSGVTFMDFLDQDSSLPHDLPSSLRTPGAEFGSVTRSLTPMDGMTSALVEGVNVWTMCQERSGSCSSIAGF